MFGVIAKIAHATNTKLNPLLFLRQFDFFFFIYETEKMTQKSAFARRILLSFLFTLFFFQRTKFDFVEFSGNFTQFSRDNESLSVTLNTPEI